MEAKQHFIRYFLNLKTDHQGQDELHRFTF